MTAHYGLSRYRARDLKILPNGANYSLRTHGSNSQNAGSKHTRMRPGDNCRDQIDFPCVDKRFPRTITNRRTNPTADCGSDHTPVVASKYLSRFNSFRYKCHNVSSKIREVLAEEAEKTLTQLQEHGNLNWIPFPESYTSLQ